MKKILLFFLGAQIAFAAAAPKPVAVEKMSGTNRLTSPLVVPSGQTFRIEAGGTIIADTGATVINFGSGGATYNFLAPLTLSGTDAGIQVANSSQAGYLSASDWIAFNAKLAAGAIGTTVQAFSPQLTIFSANGSNYYLSRANHSGTQSIATISGLQAGLDSKPTATLSTDGTLAGNSDSNVASEKAVKSYVDAHAGGVSSVNGQSGVVSLTTANVNDSTNRRYITDAQQTVVAGSTASFTTAEKTKLSGVATGATANSADAFLLDRGNHTGTQAIATITGLQAGLDAKLDAAGGIVAHGNAGSSVTLTWSALNPTHTLTLNQASCTIVLAGFPASKDATIKAKIVQDSVGGRAATYSPGLFGGGVPLLNTNASGQTWVQFWSDDGGTTIYYSATTSNVNNAAFSAGWNGGTTVSPSQDAVYDYLHTISPGDNGKVHTLDTISSAGIPLVDSSGNVTGTAVPGTNYYAPGSTDVPVADGGTGSSTAAGASVNLTPTTVAISGTSIDWAAAGTFTKTLGANVTFTFANAVDGETRVVGITNTALNYTVTWPAVSWKDGTTPTQTLGAKTDIYTFVKLGSTIYGSVLQNF